eukprot:gene3775-4176_t
MPPGQYCHPGYHPATVALPSQGVAGPVDPSLSHPPTPAGLPDNGNCFVYPRRFPCVFEWHLYPPGFMDTLAHPVLTLHPADPIRCLHQLLSGNHSGGSSHTHTRGPVCGDCRDYVQQHQ